jgi:hypothetical protein
MIRVMVWHANNNPMSSQGHAALAITRSTGPGLSEIDTYISWFPLESIPGNAPGVATRDSRGFQIGKGIDKFMNDPCSQLSTDVQFALNTNTIQPHANQMRGPTVGLGGTQVENTRTGVFSWVRVPNDVIDIPTIDDDGRDITDQRVGLCESNLKKWWEIRSDSNGNSSSRGVRPYYRFKLISKKYNCASVVTAALMASGCGLFLKPSKPLFAISPVDVLNYARKLQRKIVGINTQLTMIQNQNLAEFRKFRQDRYQTNALINNDIWTFEDWRQASAVSGIARRKEQVARIDQLIQQYWALGHWNDHSKVTKEALLEEILIQIQDHILQKPQSDRRVAVLKLGVQVRAKLDERTRAAAHDDEDYDD